jgi:hypothetical protein
VCTSMLGFVEIDNIRAFPPSIFRKFSSGTLLGTLFYLILLLLLYRVRLLSSASRSGWEGGVVILRMFSLLPWGLVREG